MNQNIITYCNLLKKEFESHSNLMQKTNHQQHDIEPNYWNILLKPIQDNPDRWVGKSALDFACGCGRNLVNLYNLVKFSRIDGVDICKENSEYALNYSLSNIKNAQTKTWENNGFDVQPCESNQYDFVMSHQSFQHISNYEVRYSLLSDLYRVLNTEGVLSVHFMNLSNSSNYYENDIGPSRNVTVDHPQQLIKDLMSIGYKNVKCTEAWDFYENRREFYLYGEKL